MQATSGTPLPDGMILPVNSLETKHTHQK